MNTTVKQYTCRLCAKQGCNYVPIFNAYSNSTLKKIHNCLPIMVDPNDQMPGHICPSCFQSLNTSYQLRSQCLQADSTLRQQLEAVKNQNGTVPQTPIILGINSTNKEYTCRLCAKKSYNFHYPIFNTYSSSIAKKIQNCLPIMIHANDQLSGHICQYCRQALNTADKLRVQSSLTDSALRKELGILPTMEIKQEEIQIGDESEMPEANPRECCTEREFVDVNNIPNWVGDICSSEFKSTADLDYHTVESHTVKEEPVEYPETNTEVNNFIENTATENSINIEPESIVVSLHIGYTCEYCEYDFKSSEDLLRHENETHYEKSVQNNDVIKEQVDDREENTATNPSANENNIEFETNCDICQATIKDQQLMDLHTNFHQQFKCDMCPKMFCTEKNLKAHMKTHNERSCTECNQQFDDIALLDQHQLQEHKIQPRRRKFCCELCGDSFSIERLLKDHQNKHTGARPYVCKICEKSFRTYSGHYAHVLRHKSPDFICNYCNKKFFTKDELKIHITIHQAPEEWRHHCEICNLKFRNHSMLRWHNKKFESTHLYTCDVCGLRVLGKYKLGIHKKQKHDE